MQLSHMGVSVEPSGNEDVNICPPAGESAEARHDLGKTTTVKGKDVQKCTLMEKVCKKVVANIKTKFGHPSYLTKNDM